MYFLIVPYSILLRMKNISDKRCRENKTHFIFNFVFEIHAIDEIMWKNMVEQEKLRITYILCLILYGKSTLLVSTIYQVGHKPNFQIS
jgi:hypothetical protein